MEVKEEGVMKNITITNNFFFSALHQNVLIFSGSACTILSLKHVNIIFFLQTKTISRSDFETTSAK